MVISSYLSITGNPNKYGNRTFFNVNNGRGVSEWSETEQVRRWENQRAGPEVTRVYSLNNMSTCATYINKLKEQSWTAKFSTYNFVQVFTEVILTPDCFVFCRHRKTDKGCPSTPLPVWVTAMKTGDRREGWMGRWILFFFNRA